MNNNVLIIAGEASGDLHGASLIRELKKLDSSLKIFGIGGNKMHAEGMELIYHIDKMAFLGFVEVIKHLSFIKKVQARLLDEIKKRKVKHVILIDYPGFNLNIAKRIKKLEPRLKLIYYITPQVWAWGKRRVKKIRNYFDKVLVVFPFEEKFFKEKNVKCEYVGHPLIEEINNYDFISRDQLNEKFNLDPEKEILLILAGSRKQEVKSIFPEAVKAAAKISDEMKMQIVVACAENLDENIFNDLTELKNFKVIKNHTYDLLKHARFGIVKSGTSTLEAGLLQLPMVIVYKTSRLTYMIGKTLVKISNIGMANIILEEKVVPELIQNDANADKIYNEAKGILSDKDLYENIKIRLGKIKEILGEKNAPRNAANSIYLLINEHKAS
ncbi:MAG TPA: lipid-A-disaccharide synthase [Ignavibacteriaceae bacterium]|jgi:lipid-A-disaccharide synthase|nr:MAG: Lipid-A-disaccharide synthase [Ignavibacteria bacterium ADurb.Bin266]OQY74061.1 MAG: lipid-A-disaccharide synthase [Ignavibacteriales bacterium UTCHB2]HQF42296.1 lipid-A-disaccharide synthase [Ignavibacteriaceae bacterium]HQI40890.1 lipid-A-disaccharide synthase [Ignavibacteriaceae bacterium]HQJ45225.1 lipid-A-disaccharide synthase [Ignavibacteriaceae bacterium]